MTEVRLGDRSVPVPRVTPFKADRAGQLIAAVLEKAPGVQERVADYTRTYEEKNCIRITPQMAKLPRFMAIDPESGNAVPRWSEGDFAAAGGVILLPESPTAWQQAIAVFPHVYEHARVQVIELLALIIAPNSELKEADENETVEEYIKKQSRSLMHDCELDQLMDVVVAVMEVLRDQFQGKDDVLGKIVAFFQGPLDALQDQTPEQDSLDSEPTEGSHSTSSTPSPAPTDGPEASASTESGSEKPEASVTG